MKSNPIDMALLFDAYGELLTERQRMLFDLYYNQDYSLAEIAENESVSRQSVHDSVAKAESSLLHMEEVIGLVADGKKREQALERMTDLCRELALSEDPAVCGIVSELERLIDSIKE